MTCIVDEVHSQFPFFVVYRLVRTSTLEKSLQWAMASESEVILAKLSMSSKIGEHQQLIFTNRCVIILNVTARRWGWCGVWHFLNYIDNIPGIGWILGILLEMIKNPIDQLFKRSYCYAKKFNAVANETILSGKKLPKRIKATRISYTKIVQPSIGVMIRRCWFASYFRKIRGTTLRLIPVGRLRSSVNGFLDAANCMLPKQLSIDKLVPVLKALIPHLPSNEINLIETKNSVSVLWPANIGIGDQRWSVRGANVVTILLVVLTLLFLSFTAFGAGSEREAWFGFFWAVLSGIGTLDSLAQRRFGEALLVACLTILLLISWMASVILPEL